MMNKLYIDCTNGISGDMLLKALRAAGAKADVERYVAPVYDEVTQRNARMYGHTHEHAHAHAVSHEDIREIIDRTALDGAIREAAKKIYKVIAEAESKVHDEAFETVHFHEVGRKEAVCNIVGIAAAVKELDIKEIYCSPLHNGQGEIECSHGMIEVPVPAVKAMMQMCDYDFITEIDCGEMVTPSGLAALIGIGAKCIGDEDEDIYEEFAAAVKSCKAKSGAGKGTRETGRDGLHVLYIMI
jgi:uncharacterized protein (DUF111 family)